MRVRGLRLSHRNGGSHTNRLATDFPAGFLLEPASPRAGRLSRGRELPCPPGPCCPAAPPRPQVPSGQRRRQVSRQDAGITAGNGDRANASPAARSREGRSRGRDTPVTRKGTGTRGGAGGSPALAGARERRPTRRSRPSRI